MSIKLKDTILDYIDKAYKDGSGNTISSTYLKLSGGTINGTTNVPLTIQTSDVYSSIRLKSKNHYVTFGMKSNGELFVTDIDGWNSEYAIYHTGNFTPSNYSLTSHTHDYVPYTTKTITSSSETTSLNNCTNSGLYITNWAFAGSPNVTDQPWSSSAATVVSFTGSYPFQLCRYYNSNDLRIRGYHSSSGWTSWQKIALSGEAQPASDVYAWAKASTKPTYTYSEVGAAAASHTHSYAGSSSAGGAATSANWLNANSNLTYGSNGLNYFNASLSTGTDPNSNVVPVSGWWHIIRMNHGNSAGYYVDIAASLNHDNGIQWRRVQAGITKGWYKLLDSSNYTDYAATKDHTHTKSQITDFPSSLPANGGNADTVDNMHASQFVYKNNNNIAYSDLAAYYTGSTSPGYYRIVLPDSVLSMWNMLTIELTVNQSYSNGYAGKILIYCHNNGSNTFPVFNATCLGTLTSSIKIYGSGGKYIYIEGCSSWGTISIDKILVGDAATGKDQSGTKIDTVSALPSTYQSASMRYNIDSGNIGSQSVNYASSAGSVAWSNVSGKPSTFTPSSHTHSYLPLSGGTLSNGGASDTSLYVRGNTTSSWIGFQSTSGTTFGWFGIDSNKIPYFHNGTTAYVLLHSGNYSSYAATKDHTHTTIVGNYTANGGQQNPNYFGVNKVGALMMNTTVNGNSHYKDWLFMDCYSGSDVGGGVAIGVNRQALGVYIMRSAAARTSWAESAELLGTHNWSTYCAAKSHTHNYASASHTHSYAGSSSAGGPANSLGSTGYGSGNFTYYQTSSEFFGNSGWTHYLISNHGDGSSYYNFTIGLPFWGVPIYKRLEGGSQDGWHTFITSENISSQSVNYATSAGNADTVDSHHFSTVTSLPSSPNSNTVYFVTG